MGIICRRERGQSHFLIAGALTGGLALLRKQLRAAGPDRPVDIPRLTEPAPPDTAPKQLQHDPVVDDLGGRNDRIDREIGLVQVLHDALAHQLRRALQGLHLLQGPVLPVDGLVEGRDIDARNLRRLQQKFFLAPVLVPGLPVELDILQGDFLPLSQHEEVNKRGQRLRVIGAGPAGHHDRRQVRPVRRTQRQFCQVQHVQHVGVGHLIAQGKADEVELCDRVAALQAVEQHSLAAHFLLHIAPGGETALAPQTVHLIHHAVQNPAAQVGHADLVGIRETQGKPGIHLAWLLDHGVVLPAGIAGRFLNLWQNLFQNSIHGASPPLSQSCQSVSFYSTCFPPL